jgi:drug/metabolite transporter (DMT)-like permease
MIAYGELALAMVIVGSSVVVGKIIAQTLPISISMVLRFAIASVVLLGLKAWDRRESKPIPIKDLCLVALQAFFGVYLFSWCLLHGLKYTSAINAGLITSTIPAVLVLLSFLFLKERLSVIKILAIGLSMVGLLVLNRGPNGSGAGDFPSERIWGNLLVFVAVVGEALFTVLGKQVSGKINPLQNALLLSGFGILFFAPEALIEISNSSSVPFTPVALVSLLYYGVFVTVIAFLLWLRGVAKVPASTAAAFTAVWPISAVGLSCLFLGEPLQPSHVIGALLIVGAIGLIALERPSHA